jgi:hypothetical protein
LGCNFRYVVLERKPVDLVRRKDWPTRTVLKSG